MNPMKSFVLGVAFAAAAVVGCETSETNAGARGDAAAAIEPVSDTVTDVDGYVYRTVTIGSQTWMAENLRVTCDPSGNPITSYFYDDDPANGARYGRLYTWDVAMNGSTAEGAQGICPDGWHIPTDAEWYELFNHLDGEALAGAHLKPGGSTGFDALLAGGADFRGNYVYMGEFALFWSSTEVSDERAYHHSVDADDACGRFAAMKGEILQSCP